MKLRLILGDQLSLSVATLKDASQDDLILMCEVKQEATYVKHHKKKIVFVFSAMRHFAQELRAQGFNIHYVAYDSPNNSGSLFGEVQRFLRDNEISQIVLTKPGEYRLLSALETWGTLLGVPIDLRVDDRFLSTPEEFSVWAKGRKQLRMEIFYREMRRKHHVLMDGPEPVGGQWNFDADNRKPAPNNLTVPEAFKAPIDMITQEVADLVAEHFPDHFGDIHPFHFAVTRDGALQALDLFITERLGLFGDYQDAMVQGEPWMYHSHIGLYLNCGLLTPLECIKCAEAAYHAGNAPLNAVEGFIRQILGWREYIRGFYWLKMPEYKEINLLRAMRSLPDFYWTGDTQMNCVRQCVLETKENAYAHHIQRLMVLGNFALIAGIDPAEVNDWYMLVYADAYEWVELPNVSGMALFADGGLLASKPYAASGAYINKMSNYCEKCSYKPNVKNGPKACPFNYLYWDFMERNAEFLHGNPRMGFMYKTLSRMSDEKRKEIADDSQRFFNEIRFNEKI